MSNKKACPWLRNARQNQGKIKKEGAKKRRQRIKKDFSTDKISANKAQRIDFADCSNRRTDCEVCSAALLALAVHVRRDSHGRRVRRDLGQRVRVGTLGSAW